MLKYSRWGFLNISQITGWNETNQITNMFHTSLSNSGCYIIPYNCVAAALWRRFGAQTLKTHTLSKLAISLCKIVVLNRVSWQCRPCLSINTQNNLIGLLLKQFYPGYISGLLQIAQDKREKNSIDWDETPPGGVLFYCSYSSLILYGNNTL